MAMHMNEFFYGGNEKPQWRAIENYQRPYDYADRRSSGRTPPTYEFRVPMCCAKCEEKVHEELSELDGVYEVFADQLSERVAVTGFVDPFQALKKMKRIKKKSEFWEGSSPTVKSSHIHSHHKKSSYKKYHPSSSHETVTYRSAPSQVSYNREPLRVSGSHRKNYASYDDRVSYSDLRPQGPSHRKNYASYDDGVSYRKNYASYDDGVSHRKNYASYDDGVSHRKNYASYDDGVAYRKNYASYDDGVSYRKNYASYDDGLGHGKIHGSYDDGFSFRKNYGSYDDGFSYRNRYEDGVFCDLPRSRPLRYETVPPFAQDYHTEEYVDEYPMFNRY